MNMQASLKAPNCDNCQLRKNEDCTQIGSRPCSDFKAIPFVSKEEKESWPDIMDATYIRLNGRGRYE